MKARDLTLLSLIFIIVFFGIAFIFFTIHSDFSKAEIANEPQIIDDSVEIAEKQTVNETKQGNLRVFFLGDK